VYVGCFRYTNMNTRTCTSTRILRITRCQWGSPTLPCPPSCKTDVPREPTVPMRRPIALPRARTVAITVAVAVVIARHPSAMLIMTEMPSPDLGFDFACNEVFECSKVLPTDRTRAAELEEPRVHARLMETMLSSTGQYTEGIVVLEVDDADWACLPSDGFGED
jgi:hypothetical protein